MMFELRRDDVVAVPAQLPGGSLEGEVVGLGAPGGENDLGRARPDGSGDTLAGVLDGGLGPSSGGVHGRGVAEVLPEEREHGVPHLGEHGCRCGVIEIVHPTRIEP